jgi:hypothetical protein
MMLRYAVAAMRAHMCVWFSNSSSVSVSRRASLSSARSSSPRTSLGYWKRTRPCSSAWIVASRLGGVQPA